MIGSFLKRAGTVRKCLLAASLFLSGIEKVIAESLAAIFKTRGYTLRMVEAKDRSLGSLMNLRYSYHSTGLPTFELFT